MSHYCTANGCAVAALVVLGRRRDWRVVEGVEHLGDPSTGAREELIDKKSNYYRDGSEDGILNEGGRVTASRGDHTGG